MGEKNAETEIKRLREMVRAVYIDPTIVDDFVCKRCLKRKQCEHDDADRCSLSEDETIEIFIRDWKGEPA